MDYSLFVKDGRLVYENNFFSKERDVIRAHKPLPKGKVTAVFDYTQEGENWGDGGTGRLSVNGESVGEAKFVHVAPARFSATETFEIGEDRGAPASNQYSGPFKFTGNLEHVVIELDPPAQDPELEKHAKEATRRIKMAVE